jgi:hypothetical protein
MHTSYARGSSGPRSEGSVTSKVRLKLGQLEVECEGTEEFLRDELPKLLETFSKLQPTVAAVGHPPADTNGVGASLPPGEKAMTTSSTAFVAQKLASQTGPELAPGRPLSARSAPDRFGVRCHCQEAGGSKGSCCWRGSEKGEELEHLRGIQASIDTRCQHVGRLGAHRGRQAPRRQAGWGQ